VHLDTVAVHGATNGRADESQFGDKFGVCSGEAAGDGASSGRANEVNRFRETEQLQELFESFDLAEDIKVGLRVTGRRAAARHLDDDYVKFDRQQLDDRNPVFNGGSESTE